MRVWWCGDDVLSLRRPSGCGGKREEGREDGEEGQHWEIVVLGSVLVVGGV